MNFTYNGYEFESRQSEAQNIVWLAGKPEDSEALPRGFNREEVAEHFIVNRNLPEFARAFKQHIIIEEIDGELAIEILKPGYNIIEQTIYNQGAAKRILEIIDGAK